MPTTTAQRTKTGMTDRELLERFEAIRGCRHHFPLLRQRVNGKPLVYFDNAATSQKPQVVIDATLRYYEEENSNIHRGVHYLSERATQAYEGVRVKVQHLLNAAHQREIIFVRGDDRGDQPRRVQLRADRGGGG